MAMTPTDPQRFGNRFGEEGEAGRKQGKTCYNS
jgi:hypothetical protein